jgi:mxaK protein
LRAAAAVQVRMLYNMANARLRAAIKATEQGKFDKAIPLVALAKAEYRSALRLAPLDWEAKHNLDVAMRLVRDLPRGEAEEKTEPETTPSKLWTDLPGIPKGLP